jgi:transposase-like protein
MKKPSSEREKTMPTGQKTFTKEFKLEEVQLVQCSHKSQAQIARDLGIADSTLSHWCKQLAEHGRLRSPLTNR